jgi:hypothetical protein
MKVQELTVRKMLENFEEKDQVPAQPTASPESVGMTLRLRSLENSWEIPTPTICAPMSPKGNAHKKKKIP